MRFSFLPTFVAMTVLGAGVATVATGCRPEIGDRCVLSTDCSTQGNRLCDTSQPDGYCTQFNCSKNSCPDEAHCILFNANVPGCGYDDRSGNYGGRIARSYCVAHCETSKDCRPGYTCTDPRAQPYNGLVLDDNQNARTCVVIPTDSIDGGFEGGAISSGPAPAPICQAPARSDAGDAGFEASPGTLFDGGYVPPLVTEGGAAPLDAGDAGDAAEGGI